MSELGLVQLAIMRIGPCFHVGSICIGAVKKVGLAYIIMYTHHDIMIVDT